MAIIPPYLKFGDTIGMVCPSGYMPFERAKKCIEVLQQWGFHVLIGKTLGQQQNYFSGTDEERLEDLQQMLDDKNINAIMCARGGYGLSRIIDKIDFSTFTQHPKWIIGYSDCTLLHAHIYSNYNIVSLHAPMAAAFNEIEESEKYIQSIYDCLTGNVPSYTIPAHHLNRDGLCKGELVGGNLSLLSHITGTKSGINTTNKILFIEDIGEYKYAVDRMLMQLKRSGVFEELSGFIAGRFTEIKDTTIPFGQEIHEMIFDKIKEYGYPACFNFPVGHVRENYALKSGGNYTLSIKNKIVSFAEVE